MTLDASTLKIIKDAPIDGKISSYDVLYTVVALDAELLEGDSE